MKIGFFGTPELARRVLLDCLDAGVQVEYVVSQPDKPVGRKAIVTPSPVSSLAIECWITLFRPERVRGNMDLIATLQRIPVDYLVVVAYGKILPQDILDLPAKLPINIHGSLLPKYRGASPIQSALLAGDQVTGVTIMRMTAGMDEGEMLYQEEIDISDTETSATLFEKFGNISGQALLRALELYESGKIALTPQDDQQATYTKKFEKEDGRIDWSTTTAKEIYQKWQAFTPWPGVWTNYQGRRCKIVSAKFTNTVVEAVAGGIVEIENAYLVATKSGGFLLEELLLEGEKSLPAKEFFARHSSRHFES